MKQSEYKGYKMGALKRKFKTGRPDQPPGTFIEKAKVAVEDYKQTVPVNTTEKVAFMGAI